MKKSQSRSKRLGIILAALMVISLLIVFLNPVIFPLYDAELPELTYKIQALTSLYLYYPMDLITYLYPFISIIYLTIVIPKDKIMKRIRYIIAVLSIIILCFIIYRWINTLDIARDDMYEDFKITNPEIIYPNDPEGLHSGYNVMNFIRGR